MKKKLLIALVAMATTVAFAEIAIEWNSNSDRLGNSTFTAYLPTGMYATLIWSATVPTAETSLLPTGIAETGEYLLASTLTATQGGGINAGGIAFTYSDAVVGGADINSGYFFTRIFDTVVPANNNYYYQGEATGNALVASGVPADLAKIYGDSLMLGNGTTSAIIDGPYAVNTQYTVVPEPATIGLFGLGILGAWFARRTRRINKD